MSSLPKKTNSASGARGCAAFFLAALAVFAFAWLRLGSHRESPAPSGGGHGARNALEAMLAPSPGVALRSGIAAVVLVDVSGSMDGTVADTDGRRRRKIEIARRCVAGIVRQAEAFAKAHPEPPLALGIDEFSTRGGQPPCRTLLPLGPPNWGTATGALDRMYAQGGTPIGEAIIDAKRALNATGFRRQHILVVTDGENTQGSKPEDVAAAMSRLPEEQRASLYFVAFDVSAGTFKAARNAGVLVLAATNERELQETLDYVLTGKILAEEPAAPARK